jgi:transposase
MDMSPPFIKGAKSNFPNAQIIFDKFHVIKLLNEAVDEVRRQEQKTCVDLKLTRYIWLKNEKNLTASQKEKLAKLKDCHLDTAKAYRMKLAFYQVFRYQKLLGQFALEDWLIWASRCRLKPIMDVAKTIKAHYDGIIRWFSSKLNNGLLEGINSVFQAAKRKARGYRSTKNIIAMIYLLHGKLNFTIKKEHVTV